MSKTQAIYLASLATIMMFVYLKVDASQVLEQQLDDTSKQLQQKTETIETFEQKEVQLENQIRELEDAKTDLEELEEESKKKDAQIEQLQKDLQVKLQRQNSEVKLAVSQPSGAPLVPAPAVLGTSNDGNGYPYGECTWGADQLANLPNNLGNAGQWAYTLPQHGYRAVAATPGAVAVFAPGVQGAGGLGHVGVVTSVGANGVITIGEANYNGNRYITYRQISSAGVQFFAK